ncbi:MAG: hypothetical protein SGJ09_10125 [Phycisphaerae bacterium]|nr:hypothetical protein [Phycisphaerae bacterium]
MSKNEPVVDLETIKADIAALRDDLGSMTSSMLRDGAKSVQSATKAVREKAASAADEVQGFIEERPLTSILIAFGAGILTATLMRRS